MDFVINYQAPIAFPKKRKVRIGAGLVRPPCQDLVGRDCDRRDRFVLSGVLRNLVLCQICFVQELVDPLVDGCDVGRDNQGAGLQHFHYLHSDDSFSGTAWKNDCAKSGARPLVGDQRFCRGDLVVSNLQVLLRQSFFAQSYLQGLSVVQGRFVLNGPAKLQKFLLYDSAVGQLQQKGALKFQAGNRSRRNWRQEFFGRGIVQDLFVDDVVACHQAKVFDLGLFFFFRFLFVLRAVSLRFVLLRLFFFGSGNQLQFSKAFANFFYPRSHILRNVVAAVSVQSFQNRVAVDSGAGRVPQRKRSQPVSVQVLRRSLQLGKGNQSVPALVGKRRVHVKQYRAIALNNQRILKPVAAFRKILHSILF